MALVFYTQRDIANIDANNISEEFVNYFDGLSEEGKKRIIDARPDLAAVLGVGAASEPIEAIVEETEGESSDITSSESDASLTESDVPLSESILDAIDLNKSPTFTDVPVI